MGAERIEVVDEASPEDLEHLEDQINEFNFAATGYRDGRRLAIFLRDADGSLRAGLAGHTWGGCCEVRFLWIREPERRRGLGSRMLAAAEREATARGCDTIVLSTHSFQAPGFYARHGYSVVGRFEGYPRGQSQIFLRKTLGRDGLGVGANPGSVS